jgi:hypothetical protein
MSDRLYRFVENCLISFTVRYCAAMAVGLWWIARGLTEDYGALPPAEVFQRVLRQPVPEGVSDLRVAGHAFVQGHQVWMRFRVAPSALKTLFPQTAAPSDWRSRTSWRSEGLDAHWLMQPQPCSIQWDEVIRAPRPEQYHFSATEQGQGWYGFFVLDRKEGIVYLWAIIL